MKKAVKWIITGVILLALVICVSTSVYTVAENEYACVVRFEKIIATTAEPGLHFKVYRRNQAFPEGCNALRHFAL